jgi:2-polyprenyl-3-methyl-5-hydroxy-6-metoxy-1,4-benzoquinol methylase
MQCSRCGFVVNPAVWKQDANEAMEKDWFGEEYDPQESKWVHLFEHWNNRRTLGRIASLSLIGRRLLEIGVGSGSFMEYAKCRGFQVMGCDLSLPICRQVEGKFHIPVHHGHVHSLPDEPSFDVVVMNHVLEHVSDPVGLLREVRRRMNRGGVLHVAVPNLDSWESRLRGWTGFEPYHLVYFRPATLKNAAERAGFLVSRVYTHESFSGWFLALLRTFLGTHRLEAHRRASMRKRRTASLSEHAYQVAMILSGTTTWPLRKLQAVVGRGDEAVLIAFRQE